MKQEMRQLMEMKAGLRLGVGLAAAGLLPFGAGVLAGDGGGVAVIEGGGAAEVATIGHGACWSDGRVDGHAPMGVMYDHTHHAGGLMVGYRYMYVRDEGIIDGSSSISNSRVYELSSGHHGNYSALPLSMDMHMHMLDIMYAPTDWLTLMVMPQYMEMDMEMEVRGGGHGHGGMHGHGHGHGGGTRTMSHGTSGWSDTVVAALFPLLRGESHTVHLGLGVSVPTGSVDEKMHGRFTHYHMQLGSGTWDLVPSLTYRGATDRLSWGGQVLGVVRLEEENSSGYRLGDVWESTAWGAVRAMDWMSLSGRVLWRNEGEIEGHYNGPHGHSSPVDIQGNYGGDRVDLGLGLNLMGTGGALGGWRLAAEVLVPVHQKSNGVFLERDLTVYLGVQKSW
jgi:hypothetical protein